MGENGVDAKCRECRDNRAHCHGTLIHHWGQQPQCTDPDCTHPEVLLHSLAIDCDAIGCDCGETGGQRLAG
jgi:hypothetical protein